MSDFLYRRIENVNGQDSQVVVTHDEMVHHYGRNDFWEEIILEGWEEFSDETFNNYQQSTAQTAKYPPQMALIYLSLGIASEAGEVAGKMNS